MREIKFRGLHTNPQTKKSKMVYGDFVKVRYIKSGMEREGYSTIESRDGKDKFNCYQVKDETVGQFTGYLDKNKKEIYEGATIKAVYLDGESRRGHLIFNQRMDKPFVVKLPFFYSIAIFHDRFEIINK